MAGILGGLLRDAIDLLADHTNSSPIMRGLNGDSTISAWTWLSGRSGEKHARVLDANSDRDMSWSDITYQRLVVPGNHPRRLHGLRNVAEIHDIGIASAVTRSRRS